MENNITFLMMCQHKLIIGKLNKILDGFGMDKNDLLDMIGSFKKDLLEHMALEEKVIFSFPDLGGDDVKQDIVKLLSDHNEIRRALENFQNLEEGGMSDFNKLLARHESLETGIFYPKLDRELDQEKKEKIINDISTKRC